MSVLPTIRTPEEAVAFYHGAIFAGNMNLNPDKGFLKSDGTSAFAKLSNTTHAKGLQKANEQAIAVLKWACADAWEICMYFTMLRTYTNYIFDDPTLEQEGLKSAEHVKHLEGMLKEQSVIAQGSDRIRDGTESAEEKESRRAGFVFDTLVKLMEGHPLSRAGGIGGNETAGMFPAQLFPHGWGDKITELVTSNGGRKGQYASQSDRIDETWETMIEEETGHIDPDSADNNDDPFGFDEEGI